MSEPKIKSGTKLSEIFPDGIHAGINSGGGVTIFTEPAIADDGPPESADGSRFMIDSVICKVLEEPDENK